MDSHNKQSSSPKSTRSNTSASSSAYDNYLYFDVDRVDNQGQTPIFLAAASRSLDMLKFLMRNGTNVTIKD